MPVPRVKICGLTHFDDIQAAIDAGADLLGFNFYPRSPRYVQPQQVKEWVAQIGNRPSLQLVGIFVDETAAQVAEILDFTGLDLAQLHGGEPPALLEALAPRAFKALRPASAEEAQEGARLYGDLAPGAGPQLLIDAYDPQVYGGTGKKADWRAAAALVQTYPRLLLAGGLTPDNVAAAIEAVRPWGVDVSSGIEHSPGRKDHDAVRAFVAAAKGTP